MIREIKTEKTQKTLDAVLMSHVLGGKIGDCDCSKCVQHESINIMNLDPL